MKKISKEVKVIISKLTDKKRFGHNPLWKLYLNDNGYWCARVSNGVESVINLKRKYRDSAEDIMKSGGCRYEIESEKMFNSKRSNDII